MAPDDYETDTEGIITPENRQFIQTRVTRQKFDDDEITNAFLREFQELFGFLWVLDFEGITLAIIYTLSFSIFKELH